MCRNWVVLVIISVLLFGGFSCVSATPPAKIVSGIVSNVVAGLVKWLWSLKSNTKTAVSSRSMMKFEDGYIVDTLFDGSKLGIAPYSLDMSPDGDLLLLDSENSNIYKISMPLSRYARPKLVAGSPEGYSGHVDGRPRDARLNHPKGLTVDDGGNVYVADTMNMAIRKISDSGVTTIAGGKWTRRGGHVDGPSEDAKFSDDFDVFYIQSSCSLLVIDRGNQAIREIQLPSDDCSYQYDGNFNLGIAALIAAGFFGYILALLQYRVRAMFSSKDDSRTYKKAMPMPPYQRVPKSVRPPLIPPDVEPELSDEGFFTSIGRLFINTGSSAAEIFGTIFSGFRKKSPHYQYYQQQYEQPFKHSDAWPIQESFVIQHKEEPPMIESRSPTSKKTYPFMAEDLEKSHHLKQSRGNYSDWDVKYYGQQQQLQRQNHNPQHLQHHHRHYSSNPKTCYEQSCETNEIVFGAVQEQDGRREAMVIKAVDYGNPTYNYQNIRPRLNHSSHSHDY